MRRPGYHDEKKKEIMEAAFEQYCKTGLNETTSKLVAAACGINPALIYTYFANMDDLIVKSTEYCMEKVEEQFMELAPKSIHDVKRFLEEVPYWTAKEHGAKYRFMYQVYTSPKYLEAGKAFFRGVEARYTEYARQLEPVIGIAWEDTQSLIFTFVRASVHYALFEDENYLKPQIRLLWEACCELNERRKNTPLLDID